MLSEVVSGCWDSRGGVNITRTRRSFTLYTLPFFFFLVIKRKGACRYSLTARSVEGATRLRIKKKYVGIFVSRCDEFFIYGRQIRCFSPPQVLIRNIHLVRHRRQMCRCAVPFRIGRKREAPVLSTVRMSRLNDMMSRMCTALMRVDVSAARLM